MSRTTLTATVGSVVAAAMLGSGLVGATSPAAAAVVTVPADSVVRIGTGKAGGTVLGTLTVTEPLSEGYLTAYPCDVARPTASNLNFQAGQTIATGAAVRADPHGDICVYSQASAHIIWDQSLEVDQATLPSHTATRKIDTRYGAQPQAGSVTVVSTGARNSTVLGTLTVTNTWGPGYLTAYPCGGPVPEASNLNYMPNQTIATGATVRTDASGTFCVFTLAAAHLIWDQSSESTLPSHSPQRKLDSRSGTQPVSGSVTVVNTGVPSATALGTLTATNTWGSGFLTAYPCDTPLPEASNLNYGPNQTIATGATVRSDARGLICIYTKAAAHIIWDQTSENGLPSHAPVRKRDTRVATPTWLVQPGTSTPFPPLVARWAPTASAALGELGLDQRYLPGVLAQIQQESSGIPDAVNGYDSNWVNGIASWGLLQVIAPTYQAYAKPGYAGVIEYRLVNNRQQQFVPYMIQAPYNLYAALNYVAKRYGTVKLDAWNNGQNGPY